MSEGEGGAVPGATEASAETAPTDNAEMQVAEAESGERQYSEGGGEGEAADEQMFSVRNSDGEDVEVSLKEMRNGYMRQADYTKKSQANATSRKEYEQTKTHLGTILGILRTGDMSALQQLHDMGFPVMDMFNDLQSKSDAHNALTEQEQHVENMRRQDERHQREIQLRDAREEQAKQAQMRQEYAAPMKRMTTAALEAVDLPRDNQHMGMVMKELRGLNIKHRALNIEDIKHAATMVRKRADAYAKSRGLVPQARKEAPPSPRRNESYKQKSPEARASGNKKSYTSFQDNMRDIARGYK